MNRSQFWTQINISETLQDIQSVGLDKLIAVITMAYTKTMISKVNGLCWSNKTLPCSSLRGSGYRMACVRRYLEC